MRRKTRSLWSLRSLLWHCDFRPLDRAMHRIRRGGPPLTTSNRLTSSPEDRQVWDLPWELHPNKIGSYHKPHQNCTAPVSRATNQTRKVRTVDLCTSHLYDLSPIPSRTEPGEPSGHRCTTCHFPLPRRRASPMAMDSKRGAHRKNQCPLAVADSPR
jgi:hypothetical protein